MPDDETRRYRAADELCSHEDCDATIRGHIWGYIRSGWFFQKDGQQFCPEHTPDWVAEWRARKKRVNPEKED